MPACRSGCAECEQHGARFVTLPSQQPHQSSHTFAKVATRPGCCICWRRIPLAGPKKPIPPVLGTAHSGGHKPCNYRPGTKRNQSENPTALCDCAPGTRSSSTRNYRSLQNANGSVSPNRMGPCSCRVNGFRRASNEMREHYLRESIPRFSVAGTKRRPKKGIKSFVVFPLSLLGWGVGQKQRDGTARL